MSDLSKIVFVVGASRSGTTMLNRILGQHESIATMNELHYFGDLFDPAPDERVLERDQAVEMMARLVARYERGLWKDAIEAPDLVQAEELIPAGDEPVGGAALFHRFLEHVATQHDVPIVAEQTPRNAYYATDLLRLLPDALILHIVRDPRSVVASQKSRWKRRKALNAKNIPLQVALGEWISYHPYTMSILWKRALAAARRAESDDRYKRVRFEDILSHPEETVAGICEFIGVQFEDEMIRIDQRDSSVRATDNRATGIQKTALDSWGGVLTAGEVRLVERCLVEEMDEFEYAPEGPLPRREYVTYIPVALWFPLHLLGTFLVRPKRFIIQLKGALLRNR